MQIACNFLFNRKKSTFRRPRCQYFAFITNGCKDLSSGFHGEKMRFSKRGKKRSETEPLRWRKKNNFAFRKSFYPNWHYFLFLTTTFKANKNVKKKIGNKTLLKKKINATKKGPSTGEMAGPRWQGNREWEALPNALLPATAAPSHHPDGGAELTTSCQAVCFLSTALLSMTLPFIFENRPIIHNTGKGECLSGKTDEAPNTLCHAYLRKQEQPVGRSPQLQKRKRGGSEREREYPPPSPATANAWRTSSTLLKVMYDRGAGRTSRPPKKSFFRKKKIVWRTVSRKNDIRPGRSYD